jgi:hypothetical protein
MDYANTPYILWREDYENTNRGWGGGIMFFVYKYSMISQSKVRVSFLAASILAYNLLPLTHVVQMSHSIYHILRFE